MKSCARKEKEKEIENEVHKGFSYDKYDNIRRKVFNGINEVVFNFQYSEINFQTFLVRRCFESS